MTLEEARDRIGRGVVYSTGYSPPEDGVITGVSASMVFVRYRGDLHPKGTNPADLTLPVSKIAATAGEDDSK